MTTAWSRQRTLVVSALIGAGGTLAVLPAGALSSGHALAMAVPLIVGGVIAASVSARPASYVGALLGTVGLSTAYAVWYFQTQPSQPWDFVIWWLIPTVLPLLVTIGWLPTALLVRLLRRWSVEPRVAPPSG